MLLLGVRLALEADLFGSAIVFHVSLHLVSKESGFDDERVRVIDCESTGYALGPIRHFVHGIREDSD